MSEKDFKEQINASIYLKILQNISDVVVISNVDGKITFKSPNIEKHFGWKSEELIGKDLLKNIHPDDLNSTHKSYNSILENPNVPISVECRYKCKDGSYKWIQYTGINLFHDKEINGVLGRYFDISAKKQAEITIEEKEDLFKSLIQNSRNAISIFNVLPDKKNKTINYQFATINAAFENSVGFSQIQLIGKYFLDVFPDTEKVWLDAMEKVYYSGESLKLENYSQELDKYFELVIYKPNSNTIALIANDISKRRNAEESLKESEERGWLFIENTPLPIAMFDTNMHYLAASKRWSIDYKLGNQNLIGRSHYDVFPEIPQKWKEDHQRVLKGEIYKNEADKFIRFDGSVQWIRYELHPWYKKNRAIGGLIMFTEDITEKIEAEQALIESEQRLKAMHNASFGGIAIHDKGIILDCNHGLSQISGYSYDELIGMDGLLLITEQGRSLVMSNIISNYEKAYESVGIRKNGEKYPLRLEARVIPYKGKNVRSVEFRDITEQKNTEKELIRAKEKAEEASRLKTEFLHNMSHEIRTPLNGILGFSELLEMPDTPDEKRKFYSQIVQNSGFQLLRIIDDILEISTLETRQQQVKEEPFNLNIFLEELSSIFKLKLKERNIPLNIKKSLNDAECQIITDKTKLNRILGNLIENSIKFTIKGFIEVGYYVKDEKLVLYVKDTGIGILPKNHKIIFERFSQEHKDISRQHGGLGLGLSISKANAQLLGGDITLKSEKGKGSTFFITLPFTPSVIIKEKSKAITEYGDETSDIFKILVAEDEVINYLYIKALFERKNNFNYKLIHAINGREAVDICINNKDIALVLMDIKMPVMNGIEATVKIKSFSPKLPIIAQTAYSTESDKDLALRHGCNDFISKPINKEQLFELINKYLFSK